MIESLKIRFCILLFSYLLLDGLILNAQTNLIKNPSLEIWKNGWPEDWRIVTKTVDFFKGGFKWRVHKVESIDYQNSKGVFPYFGNDGFTYFAIHFGVTNNEMVEVNLSEPLKKGVEYHLYGWVYKPIKYPVFPLNRITVSFSENKLLENTDPTTIKRFYSLYKPDKSLIEKHEWQYVSTRFKANGGEKHMQLSYFGLNKSKTTSSYYYYLDDFHLTELKSDSFICSIHFDNNVFNLKKPQEKEIELLLNTFIEIDSIILIGYANEIGKDEDNYLLSLNRCKSIMKCINKLKPIIIVTIYPKGEKESQGKDIVNSRKIELKVYHNGIIPIRGVTPHFDSSLMLILKKLKEDDQFYRASIDSVLNCCFDQRNELLPAINKKVIKSDSLNLIITKNILERYGYPGLSKVTPDYMNVVSLIILHSNLEIMEKYLPIVEAKWSEGEIEAWIYAYLIDRIKVERKEKQIYGTQLKLNDKIHLFEFYPIDDLKNVNKRRREVFDGGPIEKYLESFNSPIRKSKKKPSKN